MPTGIYKRKPRKHGLCNLPEYKVWLSMKSRCFNEKDVNYYRYGGRGITVSKEWKNDFTKFISDMGRKPYKGYSIDRIDNDGNYCKENCRWVNQEEQANNTRRTKLVEYNGEIVTLRKLSKLCGVNKKLLAKRIFERNWTIKRAVINKSFMGINQFKKYENI